jgi:hypothetical protein
MKLTLRKIEQDQNIGTNAMRNVIDQMDYELYGLTVEEIAIIENK